MTDETRAKQFYIWYIVESDDSAQINMKGIFTLSDNFLPETWHSPSLENRKGVYIAAPKQEHL